MKISSDYKIKSHYTDLDPNTEKFKVVLAGKTVTIHATYDDAIKTIFLLEKDPWHHDRGNTRADRNAH